MRLDKKDLEEFLEYLKANPHEAERCNQCFNCRKLQRCNIDDNEDENGMCKEYVPVGH